MEERNKEEAIKYYRKAAEQGHEAAKIALRRIEKSRKENTVEQVAKLLTKNIKKSAPANKNRKVGEVKDAAELYRLALYMEERNKEEAIKYYKKAAEQGHEAAKLALKRLENSRGENNKDVKEYSASEKNNPSTSSQVAAQSSGCLLPILVTLAVIEALIVF